VHRQVTVAVDRGAEGDALVLDEDGLQEGGQRALGPIEEFGAVLRRIGAWYLDVVGAGRTA
jgi:hypothetical protein